MGKNPAFLFYPSDWRNDLGVQSCSPAARGLWIEMLCLMHLSPIRGELRSASGSPISADKLTTMVGIPLEVARQLLSELLRENVTEKLKDGTFISRRMIEDERKADLNRARVAKSRSKEPQKQSCNGSVMPIETENENESNKKEMVPKSEPNAFSSVAAKMGLERLEMSDQIWELVQAEFGKDKKFLAKCLKDIDFYMIEENLWKPPKIKSWMNRARQESQTHNAKMQRITGDTAGGSSHPSRRIIGGAVRQ